MFRNGFQRNLKATAIGRRSFPSERDHRIDLCRSPRGQITGRERHEGQCEREAGDDQFDAFSRHQLEEVARTRAERHPQSEFRCALRTRRKLTPSRLAVSPRPLDFITSAGVARVARTAGVKPNRIQVKIATPAVKPKTRQSISKATNSGCISVLIRETTSRPKYSAPQAPTPAPSVASNRLSISNSRTSRARVAPSASLTTISRWRALARASIRLARLAQATSSASPAIASSIQSGLLYCSRSEETPELADKASSLKSRYFPAVSAV